ncbi:hypothetical protein FPZ54_18560 [Sphingomonas suaedae]|uniref:Uncharacterized protein n=1 Tax=Sphingomonas suaedae TaxID=2599297 RepID=A0A518RK35_9SPHN|nr:hypothetical protein FPZ54_18560 [Sphingomonas suaedae]
MNRFAEAMTCGTHLLHRNTASAPRAGPAENRPERDRIATWPSKVNERVVDDRRRVVVTVAQHFVA